jgi:hypothetical protein
MNHHHDHHDDPADHDPADHDAAPAAGDNETDEGSEPTAPRPLGFWLKTVDALIDREFEAAFADLGVTRRDWRLLNLIGGEVRDDRLRARLDARPHRVLPLVERGWVAGEPGAWTLTDEGRDALASLGERVGEIRSRVGGAVSSDDYATTMASLEAIARELGWDEARLDARPYAGRRGRGPWGMPPWAGHRRTGRPPFAPGAYGGAAPWGADEHERCGHRGPGRTDHASGHATPATGDVHVHVHLDDPRGRRRGHRGHREHADR